MRNKKTLAQIVIVVVLIVSIFPVSLIVPRYLDRHRLDMAIMSDTHVLGEAQLGDVYTDSLRAQDSKGQKMLVLSEAIFKEAIDAVIEKEQEVLLISGDLTDDGGLESHKAVARQLKRAEENGVSCFVINGNHDINNSAKDYSEGEPIPAESVSAAEFAEIYADFGYNEATYRHEGSLSYTADLNDEYMLIAIDCSFYEINSELGYVEDRHDSVTTDSLIEWIKSAMEKAKKQNKRILAMQHFPLALHLTDLLDSTSVAADKRVEIADILMDGGVEYVFTGHLHSQDIATIENKDGKVLYDVETAALCNYPMPIRYFVGKDKQETITTSYLSSLKEEYVPSLVPQETKEEILSDFTAYAIKVVDDGMRIKVMNKLSQKTILSLLGAFDIDTTEPEAVALADSIRADLIEGFFDTPLYGEEGSVSSICKSFGITLPQSDYTTVWSVAMQYLRANYKGDEGFAADAVETVLLKYSLYTAFYQIAEFDLFGKLNLLNDNVPAVELLPAMELLFSEGKLDVEDNGLLGILGSIKVISRFQDRWSDKPVIGNIIAGIDFSDATSILATVDTLLTYMSNSNMSVSSLLEGNSLGPIIDGLPLTELIDCDGGYLNVACVYGLLQGDLGANLIADRAPADEALVINK